MWPSQRGSPEQSQEHRRCWRCRSATSVYRTGRAKSGSLGPAPLSSAHQSPGFGVPSLPQTPGKMKSNTAKHANPSSETSGGTCTLPTLFSALSSSWFLRGPLGSRCFLPSCTSQSYIQSVPHARNLGITGSCISRAPHSVYHQILITLLLNHLLHPPFATSLLYNTIISCLKISVAS